MGIAQSLIGRLETGERNLAVTELLVIAEAVGVDPHALLDSILRRLRED